MGLVLCKSDVKARGEIYEISRYNYGNNKQKLTSENLNMVYLCTSKSNIYINSFNITILTKSKYRIWY
jgi:hypothetical protein